MKLVFVIAALVLIGGQGWVRFAPLRAEDFHRSSTPKEVAGDYPAKGAFEAVRDITLPAADVLERLDRIIRDTPRTVLLAGSIDERHLSYVTRSGFWGFPDITNVWVADGRLHIHGTLRYGVSDFGVNERRFREWIDAIGPL